MATLIKRENGDMHKICLTDAHVNAQNIQEELYTEGQYTKVEIPTSTANDARHGNKYYTADAWVDSEDRLAPEDGIKAHHFVNKSDFDGQVAAEIEVFERFLAINPDNAMAAEISTYVDALKALDSSGISFPLAHNVCSYMESTGVTSFSPLQCP